MKKIFTLIFASAVFASSALCQEEKEKKLENLENKTENTVTQDTVIVEVGDEVFSVKEMGDETRIKIGKKEFRVVENSDGVVVFKSKKDNNSDRETSWRSHNRFEGHVGGFELGFNGYVDENFNTTLAPEDYYMDLNTAKSYNFNFVLPCINIGITRHFGFATSLGLNFNKYRFDGNNSIIKDDNGVVGPYYPDPGINYSKSKFVTTYATLPLLLEVQIPVNQSSRTINIGAGGIGAVKLGSYTKEIYYNGSKQKEKHKDDYSLNVLRIGATARIGYEFFQIYGTYYFTPMFETGKGPELYPLEIGIAFTIND
jgi:hypothetical protein